MVFLAQFDYLRLSRVGNDIRNKPWANTGTRILTDNYYKLIRAREEISRLNIEWYRVYTWVQDERRLYLSAIEALARSGDSILREMVRFKWDETKLVHNEIMRWLLKAQTLPFCLVTRTRGQAIDKEKLHEDLSAYMSFPATDLNGDTANDIESMEEGDEEDGGDELGDEESPASVILGGCIGESTRLDSLMQTIENIMA